MRKENCKYLTPFKMCIIDNFPFIEADFDAITNYQLLCKVVEYLNKVIANENEQNKAIKEIQDFLNNLDLQDEVDNKLDEMAESGELQEIIASYLNANAIWCFDTVADMKEATNLINGSYARTLGYNTKGDNGGSLYKIRNITNDDEVVDEITLIEITADPQNNLVAELIVLNNTLQAEQCGAIGDYTTDDTTALQNCLDIANTNNYKVEMNKKYKTSGTLTIYSDSDVKINYIDYTGNDEAIKLDGISYANLQVNNLNSNADGISLKASSSLNNNNIIDLNYCYCGRNGISLIATKGIAYNKITFNNISPANYGIYAYSDRANYSSAFIGEITIYGGRIMRGICGIYANGTGNNLAIPSLKIYNTCLETPDMGIYLNNTEYCLIDNPRYQEMGSSRVVLSVNGDCRNTIFNGVAPLYSSSITCNITYPTSKRNPVLINCPIAETGGGVIGKGAKLYSSGISIEPITSYRNKTLGNETYTVSNNDYQYTNFLISNDSVLNLNNSFGAHNIDSFIVTIAENKTLVIYDSNGTKIYDNTGSTSSSYTKFKFYCEDNNGTDKWIYITFPYTSL